MNIERMMEQATAALEKKDLRIRELEAQVAELRKYCSDHPVGLEPMTGPKLCTDGSEHRLDEEGACQVCRDPLVWGWTLNLARAVCNRFAGTAFREGYGAPAVWGSVLYNGQSMNDLDLLLVRRPQFLEVTFERVDQRIQEIGFRPKAFGQRTVTIENRVPHRLVYRYEDPRGRHLEVIVMNLNPGEMKPQEKPLFGKMGKAEKIQAELDELEGRKP